MHLLILCTGNSARSILTEALVNHLGIGKITAQSAGSQPMGRVNPLALAVLEEHKIPTTGLSSKSWDEFRDVPKCFDFLITVCGNAGAEVCPLWLDGPERVHWGFDDPHSLADFQILFQEIKAKVQALVSQFDQDAPKAQNAQLLRDLAS